MPVDTGVLEEAWAVLGDLGGVLGHFGMILVVSWVVLGGSWGDLVAFRVGLGGILKDLK